MRVVLDTNVLISAFVFPGGPPESVYRLVLAGTIEMASSPVLLAEFARVLEDKFEWEPDMVEEAVTHVARMAVIVRPSEPVREITADPDDDRVLEAALAAEVDAIVSGDQHLLSLKDWRGIRILRPSAFLSSHGAG